MRRNVRSHGMIDKFQHLSLLLVVVVLLLGVMGVGMQYSAAGGNWEPWALPHLVRFLAGLMLMFTIALLPPSVIYNSAYLLYGGGVLLLLVVEIFGHIGMGAQRWVRVGFINLQPSELVKIFLVLALARFYHQIALDDVNRKHIMVPPLLMIGIPAALILLQPNLGTATILSGTGVAVLFFAGIKWWKFAVCIGGGLAAAPIGWQFLHDYQKQRVYTFLDPESDPLGAGYNIMQSKIAIGSGKLWGKGFLGGSQSQLDFLPEKQTDFIFTMLAEEFGLTGGLFTLALFAILVLYSLRIAISARNHFGRMVAGGISVMLFCHIFINMAMIMGLIPVVGIPLPLLSYGGSVMISSLVGIGLILNVHVNRDAPLHRAPGDVI